MKWTIKTNKRTSKLANKQLKDKMLEQQSKNVFLKEENDQQVNTLANEQFKDKILE